MVQPRRTWARGLGSEPALAALGLRQGPAISQLPPSPLSSNPPLHAAWSSLTTRHLKPPSTRICAGPECHRELGRDPGGPLPAWLCFHEVTEGNGQGHHAATVPPQQGLPLWEILVWEKKPEAPQVNAIQRRHSLLLSQTPTHPRRTRTNDPYMQSITW